MSTISACITYVGYVVLTYKTMKSLSLKKTQEPSVEMSQEEKQELEDSHLHIDILKRWLTFIAFLLLEPFLFEISHLIPFSLIFFLSVKVLIIYPHFLFHLYLYELLQRLELDNYAESKVLAYASTILKEGILLSLDLISDAVKYVNLGEILEVKQKMDKINQKIGFKQEVCEKKKELLSKNPNAPNIFKSSVEFSYRNSSIQ